MKYNMVVILGKPGSGKGTQAKLLSEKPGFSLFVTSDHLRELSKKHPTVGTRILEYMNNGLLVPYWVVSYLWISFTLEKIDSDDCLLFDGAVRKVPEATLFHDVMTWLERRYAVIYLNVPDDELMARLQNRAQIEKRADDDEKVIQKRLEEYKENTQGSLDIFKEKGTLITIDGSGTVEEIHERLLAVLQ